MRPLIHLEAESRIRLRSAAGGAAAADSSRLMGVDRLGRRSGGEILDGDSHGCVRAPASMPRCYSLDAMPRCCLDTSMLPRCLHV